MRQMSSDTRRFLDFFFIPAASDCDLLDCGSRRVGRRHGSSSSGSGGTLTLYSAQHEQMTNALAKAFEGRREPP